MGLNVNVEKVIEKHTNEEGVVDYNKVNNALKSQINHEVTKKEEAVLKSIEEKAIKEKVPLVDEPDKLKSEDKGSNNTELLKIIVDQGKKMEVLATAVNEVITSKKNQTQKESLSKFGVDSNYSDDVLSIAKTKVNENTTLEEVVTEMKEDSKYNLFFKGEEVPPSKLTPGNNAPGAAEEEARARALVENQTKGTGSSSKQGLFTPQFSLK